MTPLQLDEIARLFRDQKQLQLVVSYRKVNTGIKSMGWKWTVTSFHDNGAHRHIQASRLPKAIEKLMQIEGILLNDSPPIG